VPKHRHERDDPGAARNEVERPARRAVPDEVPADRAPQLEAVAAAKLLRQERRDLAVLELLDGEHDALAVRRCRERVAALGLVAVLRGQADVHVLAGPMSGPAGNVENETRHPPGLADELDDLRQEPAERREGRPQSPQYRCSRHGSP
jgi:hypothetical protein